jgi:hypothetical protein
MAPRIYPDVNTSSASSGAANQPDHRLGQDINTVDQLASPVLLGVAVAGSAVACLLIWLLERGSSDRKLCWVAEG